MQNNNCLSANSAVPIDFQ